MSACFISHPYIPHFFNSQNFYLLVSFPIRDYSLSQTTLDDVFIHFASQQSEEQSLAGEEEEEERRVGHYGPLPDIVTHSRGVRGYTCVVDVNPLVP